MRARLDPSVAALHAATLAALTAYDPTDDAQRELRSVYLDRLHAWPDVVLKEGPPAHLTASCVVLDAAGGHTLLALHRRARRWLQFGGHLEPTDTDPHAAATREAREESGIEGVAPRAQIVELDRHVLNGDFGRCREHLDIRYAAVLPVGAQPTVSAESLDVRWWPVVDLPEGPSGEVARLVDAALRATGLSDGGLGATVP